MPRDGSGVYHTLAGTDAITDQTIDSGRYNNNVHDVETDLNAPRPIIAGGTGAGNAVDARHNIGAEVSSVQVTNYDSHPWESGSFFSFPGSVPGAPTADGIAGIAYTYPDANYKVALEARDFLTGIKYSRWFRAGSWSPWVVADGSDKVSKSGDTMSGTLAIQGDLSVNGQAYMGQSIELNYQAGTSQASYIDFHSVSPATDFETRLIRQTGPNGDFQLYNTGTGQIAIGNAGTGPITLASGNLERVRITYLASNGGIGVLSMNGTSVDANLCGIASAQGDLNLSYFANANHYFNIAGVQKAYISANNAVFTPKISGLNGIEITGDFSYLGGYNTGGGIHPAVGKTGIAIGWNASSGDGETDFWNCYTAFGARSFSFKQLHGDGTSANLVDIWSNGEIRASNHISTIGGLYASSEIKSDAGVLRMNPGGDAYLQYVPGTGTWNLQGGGYFNFATQNVSAAGNVIAGGDLVSNHGYISSVAPAGSNCHFVCYDETNAPRGYFYWDRATDTVRMYHPTGANKVSIDTSGKVELGQGFFSRQGVGGALSSNVHNFEWVPATGVRMWVDNVNSGIIAIVCDHRIKKDIEPLPSMWDKVKALNPISYTPAEYGELWPASDEVRWGLVAHEVQEALISSAASGTKDGQELQSPNTLAIIAALTRALQEAMQRIEALEART